MRLLCCFMLATGVFAQSLDWSRGLEQKPTAVEWVMPARLDEGGLGKAIQDKLGLPQGQSGLYLRVEIRELDWERRHGFLFTWSTMTLAAAIGPIIMWNWLPGDKLVLASAISGGIAFLVTPIVLGYQRYLEFRCGYPLPEARCLVTLRREEPGAPPTNLFHTAFNLRPRRDALEILPESARKNPTARREAAARALANELCLKLEREGLKPVAASSGLKDLGNLEGPCAHS